MSFDPFRPLACTEQYLRTHLYIIMVNSKLIAMERASAAIAAKYMKPEFGQLMDCFHRNMEKAVNDEIENPRFSCPLTKKLPSMFGSEHEHWKRKWLTKSIKSELVKNGWNVSSIVGGTGQRPPQHELENMCFDVVICPRDNDSNDEVVFYDIRRVFH